MIQEVIVAKKQWEDFNNGYTNKIDRIKGSQLHHLFGDEPQEHIVLLKIIEMKYICTCGMRFDSKEILDGHIRCRNMLEGHTHRQKVVE